VILGKKEIIKAEKRKKEGKKGARKVKKMTEIALKNRNLVIF